MNSHRIVKLLNIDAERKNPQDGEMLDVDGKKREKEKKSGREYA